MAEHSMCHPGRPWPQGDAHEGSPGLAAFHRAKSRGFFFRSSTSTHLIEGPLGELAVLGKALHRIVDVPFHLVGMTFFNKPLDQSNHLRDVLRGLRFNGRGHQPQGPHIGIELLDVPAGDLLEADAFFLGPFDDLVVHISEVAHIGNLIPLVPEKSIDHIENHGAAGVADVAEVINRDPAGIHTDPPLVQGDKLFLFLGHGVIDAQRHWFFLRQ
jgi:hypothetical protein